MCAAEQVFAEFLILPHPPQFGILFFDIVSS